MQRHGNAYRHCSGVIIAVDGEIGAVDNGRVDGHGLCKLIGHGMHDDRTLAVARDEQRALGNSGISSAYSFDAAKHAGHRIGAGYDFAPDRDDFDVRFKNSEARVRQIGEAVENAHNYHDSRSGHGNACHRNHGNDVDGAMRFLGQQIA